MEYKLISMDFDGTLLTSDKKVTEKTKKTLLKYKNKKYIIVGITARNLISVNNVCDINMFDYLILNNGCYIYDVLSKKTMDVSSIDENTQLKITNYFKDIAERIDYCSLNNYYRYGKLNVEDRSFIVKINSIDEIKESISKINVFIKDTDKISEYAKAIENDFSAIRAFKMMDSDNTNESWITIHPRDTDKFKALENLCLDLNIKIDEVIFFGDGPNDISIINKVGLGVAMSNALDEVKGQAKEVTLSNNEDGIAYFLEKFLRESK